MVMLNNAARMNLDLIPALLAAQLSPLSHGLHLGKFSLAARLSLRAIAADEIIPAIHDPFGNNRVGVHATFQ